MMVPLELHAFSQFLLRVSQNQDDVVRLWVTFVNVARHVNVYCALSSSVRC